MLIVQGQRVVDQQKSSDGRPRGNRSKEGAIEIGTIYIRKERVVHSSLSYRWSAQFLKSTTVVDNPVSFVVSTLRNT